MVKRKTRKHRQRGGFSSGYPEEESESMLNSIGSYFSSATEKANNGLGSIGSSISDSASSWTSSLNPWSSSEPVQTAGRRRSRSKRRKMRGGKGGLGLAYYATEVSGIKMAEPNYWIKGGSRKHRRKTRRCRKR